MASNYARNAGAILFLGVVQFALFEMTSEFVYPGYSVSANYISDLGPPCQGGSACPSQTSWMIFDASIVIMGLAVVASAYLIYRHYRWKPFSVLIGVFFPSFSS